MKRQDHEFRESAPMLALRRFAMTFPETEEGTSCVKRAFKARKKAFFYLGMHDETYNIMVKLVDSIDEAERLEASDPDCYRVGAHGWTTVTYSHDRFPPKGLIERWIDESYRAIVHKDLVAMLRHEGAVGAGPPAPKGRKTANRKSARKKASKKKPTK